MNAEVVPGDGSHEGKIRSLMNCVRYSFPGSTGYACHDH
jgi:hypothetical protein